MTSLSRAIVGGEPISLQNTHPGHFNSVALLSQDETGPPRFFCTGSIIAMDLILTAKHCVAGKSSKEVLVYFGHQTTSMDPSRLRKVQRIKSVFSDDWISYFPNLDIAVIKIIDEIPNSTGLRKDVPHYQPLEILSNVNLLNSGPLHIVGFGNRNPLLGAIWAGEAHTISSVSQEFIQGPFFQNLILIKNKPGQGVCHGDSGGPAYIYHERLNKWMIAGVANGFDLSLTPDSLRPLNDPLFPVIAKCESGQVIYGFAGAYKDWIQKEFQVQLPFFTHEPSNLTPQFEKIENKSSFKEWCLGLKVTEPGWLTARTLIIKALKLRSDQFSERSVFENCELAHELVGQITEVTIDDKDDIDLWEPLESLAAIKTLNIYNRKDLDLSEAQVFMRLPNLKKLSLIKVGITDWSWMKQVHASLTHLEIIASEFKDFSFLESWSKLIDLNLSNNLIEKIHIPAHWHSLTHLNLSNNQISAVLIESTHLSPVELDFSLNQLRNLSFLRSLRPKVLEVLNLNGNSIGHDLELISRFKNIKQLYLKETSSQEVSSLKILTQLELLDISQNQIQSLSPLQGLSNLQSFMASGNPIKNSPSSCPVKGRSTALGQFCREKN